jgi:glycerol-3-phosphate acyltransferase PlsY
VREAVLELGRSPTIMDEALVTVVAYLVGSIPFAFLLSRRRGVDLHRAGSGNIGATNVLRTSGVRAATLAVVLDGVKGCLAVLEAQVLSGGLVAPATAAFASVVGHVYPVWLRFRGGKGVATAAGAFAVLAPFAFGVAVVVFVAAVGLTRFVSVGSIAAAAALTVVAAVGDTPTAVIVGAAATTALIVHRHRGNLSRLLAGTERRVSRHASETAR